MDLAPFITIDINPREAGITVYNGSLEMEYSSYKILMIESVTVLHLTEFLYKTNISEVHNL